MQRLPASFGSYVEKGAATILLLALSVAVVIYFVHAVLSVSHPYPLDYGEAPLIDQAMRLAAGQNIYRPDLSSPPYTIANYPPLYVLSLAPFVKLFGPTFLAGRAISVLCAVASAIFGALIVYSQTKDRVAAVTSGMLLLAIPYVAYWSSLARIDLLALALSLAGLYLLARWPTTQWSTIASALLLVAAIYTRQSYALAAPLAAFVWLWTRDRRPLRRSLSRAEPRSSRQALGLAAMVGGLALILFLTLNALTRGGFYFNIVTANVNEFGVERLQGNLRRLRDTAPVLLVIGGAFLVLAPGRVRSWPLLVPYLIGAALSALTIGKIGSNVNYFLELSAALSLAAGALVAWSRKHRWLRVALLVLLALQTGQLMQTMLDEYAERLNGRLESVRDVRKLKDLVAGAEGLVLADEYMGLVTLQGRPLYIQPFEVTQLANAGLWDQTPFIESIRDKEFSLILVYHHPNYAGLHKERWTPEMLAAIKKAYVLADLVADTRVYRAIGSRAPTRACPGAPWKLPTSSDLGMQWRDAGLDFFGLGNENDVPVYAVADGLLTRLPDWDNAVAIQHDDPLRSGDKVWSYYAHMASASGLESFVARDFPPGSTNVPVRAGQVLGYQGRWSGQPLKPVWMHLRFFVVRAAEGWTFPGEVAPENVLDPSPYLGIVARPDTGHAYLQPLRCQE